MASEYDEAMKTLTTALREFAREVGPEAFEEVAMQLAIEFEDELRKSDAENPLLKKLDAWRLKEARGVE